MFWKIWAEELIEKKRFDAVFVRETPLSNQVIAAAQKFNIPVYLDMRENLSAMYKAGRGKSMMRCITRPIVLLKMYESRVLPRFSHIFTVSDELGEWVSKSYAIPSDKISTLSNFSSQRYLSQAERAMVKAGEIFENRKIIMVHAGYVVENRGLQDILKGLKIIVEKGYQQVNLRVIGQGAYVETLITLSKELGVQNNVEFLPLLPPEDVADALAECHIGICSYLLNEQTHQTLPGKLFEYMAVGLPVVTSARRPVVRIIEQEQCGIIYYSRDPKEIANSILALVTDRKLMQKMSDRSKRAISQRYNPKVNIVDLDDSVKYL